MNHICNQQTEKIFQDNFTFFGLLSSEGFLLDLRGEIFDESHAEPELLVGHKFSETVFWQSAPEIPELLQNAIQRVAQGVSSKINLDFRVNAQKNLVVALNLTPWRDDTENSDVIFFSATDITAGENERAEYKRQSRYLSSAAEAGEIGLWFWDLEKGENFSTPKCADLFDLSADEDFSYESLIKSVHREDIERVAGEIRRAQAGGGKFRVEFRAANSGGDPQWLNVRGETFYDAEKNPFAMTGTARKITDRKLALDEFAKVNEAVLKARDEAEAANRSKDYFLAFVSHELRSPLNSILGWAKILLTKEVNEETRRNALETIERSAKSQSKLIDDLVDSARVASGKLKLELRPVNLYTIVENVFDSQKPDADAKQIKLKLKSDTDTADVFGDSVRLQQVFSNLLTNALKFTPENGEVIIKFESGAKSATITVEDSGRGISPDFLPTIFDQYAQESGQTSNNRSGLGLGLTIVKTLIEKHGGSISAESEGVGRGAKFVVTLPLLEVPVKEAPPQKPESVNSPEKNLALTGIKVLVVEDDPDSREVLQLFLEQSGAAVESAESVSDAWKILTESENKVPDVIVSDLAMPVEDGYSFIRRVRQIGRETLRKIPALALSAFATPENREKALASGFQLYHTKPFEPDGIVRDILNLVENNRL